jgi:spore photoproduct lyase
MLLAPNRSDRFVFQRINTLRAPQYRCASPYLRIGIGGVPELFRSGAQVGDGRWRAMTSQPAVTDRPFRRWQPKRLLVLPGALDWPHARGIAERCAAAGVEIVELRSNRLPAFDADPRRAYAEAKATLAVTVASAAKRRLQPIPPSADWRVDLAEGCPAHCSYCYLAGSLKGPPITRVHANLDEILGGLAAYVSRGTITSRQAARMGEGTTFEASCYTDPLAIEHLTGSLATTIAHFGHWDAPVQLRFTTKFDAVEPLLALDHGGRTRMRASVNARGALRFEGGTARIGQRLAGLRRMADAGYPVGLTVAPIIAFDGWREGYAELIDAAARALDGAANLDLTVELITHRFTPGSKSVLAGWYPGSPLEMDEAARAEKRTKFGSRKFVYPPGLMRELRGFLEAQLAERLPAARLLYFT